MTPEEKAAAAQAKADEKATAAIAAAAAKTAKAEAAQIAKDNAAIARLAAAEAKAAKAAAPRTRAAAPHHVTVGAVTLSAYARTKTGKDVIKAAGVEVKTDYGSAMAAKKVVRAMRKHLVGDDGAVVRGTAKVAPGAEPAVTEQAAA